MTTNGQLVFQYELDYEMEGCHHCDRSRGYCSIKSDCMETNSESTESRRSAFIPPPKTIHQHVWSFSCNACAEFGVIVWNQLIEADHKINFLCSQSLSHTLSTLHK